MSLSDWKSLGEQLLKHAQVRLRSATGDDMGVSGVELTALVARATRSLCFSNETW